MLTLNRIDEPNGRCDTPFFEQLFRINRSIELNEPADDAGPAGLMAGAEAGARIAVEILIEQNLFTPVRVLASSGTSPEVTKYRAKSCGIMWPAISAITNIGMASRQRTWTPKCWSNGSAMTPGKARRQYKAQIARGTHVTNAKMRHRRTIPCPLAGMSPIARCRRNHGSWRTKEKASSSVLAWVSLIYALYPRSLLFP